MKGNKLITLFVVAVFIFVIIWVIFGPHPGKQEASISDEIETPEGLSYSNPELRFSLTVPKDFMFDEAYVYLNLGPGKEIHGVKFAVPANVSQGTNLSSDSYFAVERISDTSICAPANFLNDPDELETKSLGQSTYQFGREVGAGAGNMYDESVYVTKANGFCYALRYFIHSTNIGNYEPGSVTEFNRENIVAIFDSIAATFKAN
jgi:hypothetical protein